jgi:transcriptional regulator with XRE-family HTH domain
MQAPHSLTRAAEFRRFITSVLVIEPRKAKIMNFKEFPEAPRPNSLSESQRNQGNQNGVVPASPAADPSVGCNRAAMQLDALRDAKQLTQVQMAQLLKISQGAVSKVERRTDMFVSTLRNYVRAIGGDLEIRAVFPEGDVLIDQFSEDKRPVNPAPRPAPRRYERKTAAAV